jgi:futalosine hydrolase
MKLLVVSATELEIKPFLESNNFTDVLITGVGIPASIYYLTRKLTDEKYDLVIQAGIAGTFNKTFSVGNVVVINQDTFGDLGIDEKGNFSTLFDLGFINANNFPFKDGWLFNDNKYFSNSALPLAKAVTVNKITDDGKQLKKLHEKFNADIESMEGAAFHYVCLQQKINFLQLRSISNSVGERDKTKWKMKDAITNLNTELDKLIQNFK